MEILKKPLTTKKVSAQNDEGVYGFIVDKRANKVEVKQAVQDIYKVKVCGVNTMRYAGKTKTRYTKSRISQGKQPSYKKALVKLKKGNFIDFYGHKV